jgi:hypothetical protein
VIMDWGMGCVYAFVNNRILVKNDEGWCGCGWVWGLTLVLHVHSCCRCCFTYSVFTFTALLFLYYVVAHTNIFLVQNEDITDICLPLPCLVLQE